MTNDKWIKYVQLAKYGQMEYFSLAPKKFKKHEIHSEQLMKCGQFIADERYYFDNCKHTSEIDNWHVAAKYQQTHQLHMKYAVFVFFLAIQYSTYLSVGINLHTNFGSRNVNQQVSLMWFTYTQPAAHTHTVNVHSHKLVRVEFWRTTHLKVYLLYWYQQTSVLSHLTEV